MLVSNLIHFIYIKNQREERNLLNSFQRMCAYLSGSTVRKSRLLSWNLQCRWTHLLLSLWIQRQQLSVM